jgi:hypothetical protein
MRIGKDIIDFCNDCEAYKWGGECTNKGDHGHQCGFGAFHSWFSSYNEKHPIPDNCPIKSSDLGPVPVFMCDICEWKGETTKMDEDDYQQANSPVFKCPECGSQIDTDIENRLDF